MPNRLADESSPYLRAHADDPVEWFAWGPDAFAEAERRDRPMLVSIGYSSCHWCHVMARESFADPHTADVLNRLFVCVKVDREERPDVDALYLDATQALTGSGGWPMTVFAFPDGRPFFAGTYFPRTATDGESVSLLEVCFGVDHLWRSNRDDLAEQADVVTGAIIERATMAPAATGPGAVVGDAAVERLLAAFDPEWGGFGTEPKFPQPTAVDLLVRHWQRTGDATVAEAVTTTLDAMASGGILDQLGGGFARYAVDRQWRLPHFERLLCDQAMVARCYLHAHQLTGRARYRQVLDEVVDYVEEVLSLDEGGFASAEDAESEGIEGRYWTWDAEEFADTLTAGGFDPMEQATATLWWGVTTEGNVPAQPGRTVLHRTVRGDLLRPPVIERARRLLVSRRRQRPRPTRDDTAITEWNALWVSTLAEAALALGEPAWRRRAVRGGQFLIDHLRGGDGRWRRTWHPGRGAHHLACAADYAALVDAFTRLAELTGDPAWIGHARACADDLLTLFWDGEHGGVFTTGADAPSLVARTKDLADNALPSANSAAASALARLGALCADDAYTDAARASCRLVGDLVSRHPGAFTHLLGTVELLEAGAVEIVVSGDRPDLVRAAAATFLPRAVLAWGTPWDSPLWQGRSVDDPGRAYVCRRGACGLPATDADTLVSQLEALGAGSPPAAVHDLGH
jgi:uncharacterized protein YyaL (SSP411 family)